MSFVAVLLLAAAFATPAVRADEPVEGKKLSISLDDLPVKAQAGSPIRGKLTINIFPDTEKVIGTAQVQVYMQTVLGHGTLSRRTLRVTPGTSKSMPIRFHFPADTPAGNYTIGVQVVYGVEALSDEHTIEVVAGGLPFRDF